MPTKSFKILGQEPAAVLAVVRAGLTMLVTFGLASWLTTETSGVILAAVSAALGLVEAYATRTTLYSAALGFAQAILILAVTFGLNLDDVKQGALLSFIALLLGFFLRDRTSSVDTAISNASPGKTDPSVVVVTPPPVQLNNVAMPEGFDPHEGLDPAIKAELDKAAVTP